MRHTILVALLAVMSVGCAPGEARQAEPQTSSQDIRVMVIGTYHFSNPGLDVNNIEADSVLTDSRQAELAALANSLAEFEPTLVAVERVAPAPYVDPVYLEFDTEDLQTVANERVQIGYRVASLAGLEAVYAIDEQPEGDEPDYFPYGALVQFAEETGKAEALAKVSDMSEVMSEFEEALKSESVSELLLRLNVNNPTDSFYWNVLTLGEGERQPGPELAAYWFLRNAKIFNKLTQVAQPGDRVIIVYGAGHGSWLREMVERTDGYVLEDIEPYLRAAMNP